MATLKINVMSIVAVVVMVSSIVAVGLYESKTGAIDKRASKEQTYEAFLVIAILLALVVLIVTCVDIESLTGKTFLIYAVTAVLLLIGIIVYAVHLKELQDYLDKINKVAIVKLKMANEYYASAVFAGIAFVAAIAGTIAPFVCNK